MLNEELLQRCATLAIDGIGRSYPYHLSHVVTGPGRIDSPSELTPVFYGCFDWHSAVHGHWLLARVLNRMPGTPFADICHHALDASLTEEGLRREAEYVAARPLFERPYGLAWVLALAQELDGTPWRKSIEPLECLAQRHINAWLKGLSYPVRSGTHNQTAFAMVLALDHARGETEEAGAEFLEEIALAFYGSDREYALHLEPSGEDFLSPALSSGWLMSRVLKDVAFTAWLDQAMPQLGHGFAFQPAFPSDRSDGRFTHLDGLNLSRAWMLKDIAGALQENDPRRAELLSNAQIHRSAGLEGLESGDYAGSHWLGTFAAYLETGA